MAPFPQVSFCIHVYDGAEFIEIMLNTIEQREFGVRRDAKFRVFTEFGVMILLTKE